MVWEATYFFLIDDWPNVAGRDRRAFASDSCTFSVVASQSLRISAGQDCS